MEFINLGSMLGAFAITMVLMASHYLSPLISKAPGLTQGRFKSFAGGAAVAYVFLHMLPELVEGNQAIGGLLKDTIGLTPLLDQAIFILALAGFCLYYGLELLATRAHGAGETSRQWAYRLHLFMYCLYNFLITYTMPLRVQTGLVYAAVFTGAMALHFVLTDRNFNRHFHDRFSHSGRLLLLSALLAGWLVTALTEPVSVLLVSLLVAFLAGSILYNVFREELPTGGESSYGFFVLGLGVTSLILVLQVLMHAKSHAG